MTIHLNLGTHSGVRQGCKLVTVCTGILVSTAIPLMGTSFVLDLPYGLVRCTTSLSSTGSDTFNVEGKDKDALIDIDTSLNESLEHDIFAPMEGLSPPGYNIDTQTVIKADYIRFDGSVFGANFNEASAFNKVLMAIASHLKTLDSEQLRNDANYAKNSQRALEELLHSVFMGSIAGNAFKTLLTSKSIKIRCESILKSCLEHVVNEHPMDLIPNEVILSISDPKERKILRNRRSYQLRAFDTKFHSKSLAINVVFSVCMKYAKSHLSSTLLVSLCKTFPNHLHTWRTAPQITDLVVMEVVDEIIRLFLACTLLVIDCFIESQKKDREAKELPMEEKGAFVESLINSIKNDIQLEFLQFQEASFFKEIKSIDFGNLSMFRAFSSTEGSFFSKDELEANIELKALVALLEGLFNCYFSKEFLFFILCLFKYKFIEDIKHEFSAEESNFEEHTATINATIDEAGDTSVSEDLDLQVLRRLGAKFKQSPQTPLPTEYNTGLNFMLSHIFINLELRRLMYQFFGARELIKYILELVLSEFCQETTIEGKSTRIHKYVLKQDLPIEVFFQHLPMICTPRNFEYRGERLVGGYLATEHLQHVVYCTISAKDLRFFNVAPNERLLKVLNLMQSVKFRINKELLLDILNNKDFYIKQGLLTEPFPDGMSPEAYFKLECNKVSVEQYKTFKSQELWAAITERATNLARENSILELAKVFLNFDLYFTCYLDFRGRIYRPGLLNIQGCALGKALLTSPYFDPKDIKGVIGYDGLLQNNFFWDNNKYVYNQFIGSISKLNNVNELTSYNKAKSLYIKKELPIVNATMESPFIYQSYSLNQQAMAFYTKDPKITSLIQKLDINDVYGFHPDYTLMEYLGLPYEHIEEHIELAMPLDFLNIPVRLDATCSVYQIMSFLIKDVGLAESCNVLAQPNQAIDTVNDLYTIVLQKFMEYLAHLDGSQVYKGWKTSDNKPKISDKDFGFVYKYRHLIFDRKMIKSIVMPVAYGMTFIGALHRVERKIREVQIAETEMAKAATLLVFIFVKGFFKGPQILTNFLSAFAKLVSNLGLPVRWDFGWGTITQQYMQYKEESITLYTSSARKSSAPGKKAQKQRVQISLEIEGINTRKNATAISANFVHSLDAAIAYCVTEKWFSSLKDYKVVLANSTEHSLAELDVCRFFATVHDCFVFTPRAPVDVCALYKEACRHILHNPIYLMNCLIVESLNISVSNETATLYKQGNIIMTASMHEQLPVEFLTAVLKAFEDTLISGHTSALKTHKDKYGDSEQKALKRMEKEHKVLLDNLVKLQLDFLQMYSTFCTTVKSNGPAFDQALKDRPGVYLT